ncbi:DUF6443 domain-containing protein [Puia dinghuensis]|uniref:DUF6443 domain-containing protein n=1 Tax=Puia dinghuensis TaxID=1792502 RepID=A0A8J2XTT2_9BACT|nr:DUF6443 domain-containing protein [Puia dinghuensis]GGB06515.1 hypothetical protein GCM10011511_32450 [Puia dinghuensis]
MKKNLLLITIVYSVIAINQLHAQSQPYIPPTAYTGTAVNYTRIWEATAPGQTSSTLLTGPLTDVKQTTQYFDGWGRPMQTVLKQGSPLGNDMVTAHVYNSFGHEQYQFLPFTSSAAQSGDVTNDGKFKADAFLQQETFYDAQLQGQPNELYANGANLGPLANYTWAYSQVDYEQSPLNRTLDTYAPGVNWAGTAGVQNKHNVQVEALINTSTDNVQMWSIGINQGSIPVSSGAYGAGQLYKTITINEQGAQTITYKDRYGQVILKKVMTDNTTPDIGGGSAHSGWLCTYNVYDDYGHLRFIIPPDVVAQIDGSWSISQTQADELCYRFEYDGLDRMIIKKTPGTPSGSGGEVWMVYDMRNRLVMTQDGNMRAGLPSQPGQPQWLCYLYDGLNRQVMSGTITSSSSLLTMQNQVNGQTSSNSSGSVSIAAPSAIQGVNIPLNQPNTTGDWRATQSITLGQGFSTPANGNFSASIGLQPATASGNITVNNNPIPSGLAITQLTATFYDNYNWLNSPTVNQSALLNTANTGNSAYFVTSNYTSPTYAAPIVQSTQIQGLVTGKIVATLGSPSQNLYAFILYDDRGRVIQTQSYNITGGTDVVTNQYDFSGKMIRTLQSHNKAGINLQSHLVSTAMNYDAMERLLSLTKSVSSTTNGVSTATPVTTLVQNQYDELGRLKTNVLGNNLETQQFDYNVRGWSLGMNRAFAETAGAGANYFGFDLGYDNGNIAATGTSIGSYATPIFNGNLAGTVWKSKGDNQVRKYDYTYDMSSRLKGADFNQLDGSTFDKTAGIDFSVSLSNYDLNGNIGSMQQNGWIPGGSQPIDQLTYNYLNGNNSNRLQYVADNSSYNAANPASKLGDFHYAGTKSSTTTDYGYDANGNVTSDANRAIGTIAYNYLNLPQTITITNSKGNIQFVYDAAGNKVRKITTENSGSVTYNGSSYTTSITTTTTYIDGFVYKSVSYGNPALSSLQYTDELQFIGSQQGRVRALYTNATNPTQPTGYAFDYFIRDNVNNVRMVLTDEQWQDTYPAATLETGSINTEQNYYSILPGDVTATSSLTWWSSSDNYVNSNPGVNNPGDAAANQISNYVYRLNAGMGDRVGLGITLKVMAGDQVSIFGKSIWHNSGATITTYPVSLLMGSLLNVFAGTPVVTSSTHSAVTGATLSNSGATTNPLTTLLNNQPSQPAPSTEPNAGISWVLFNDQFVPVGMSTDLVSSTGDVVKSHALLNVPMTTNGYLFVFCDNKTNQDVFFDNLQVVQTRGPILEETHYYPAGLVMAGISDRAWNKLPNFNHYQSKEMQDQEFSDGTGLAEHDFGARFYDQQLGRWHTQDPASQYSNPYLAMGNNWPNGKDKDGRMFGVDDLIVMGIGFITNYVGYGLETHHWGGKALVAGAEGAAIAEIGYYTLGGGNVAFMSTDAATESAAMSQFGTAMEVGGYGSIKAAVSFAAVYSTTEISNLIQQSDQLKSDSWSTVGLFAGYSATAAIQAGFQSNHMQNLIDGWVHVDPNGLLGGSLSNAFGGAISNTGNKALQAYNAQTHKWDFSGSNLGEAAWEGFTSNYEAQIVHNQINNSEFLKKAFGKVFQTLLANAGNALTQQLVQNQFETKPYNEDLYGYNTFYNTLGGWPNDFLPDNFLTPH